MKKSLIVSCLGTLIILLVASMVQAQTAATSKSTKSVIYVPADKAQFKQSPTGGASIASLWGDPDKAAHGTLTKFEPAYDAGMHIHTNDVWLVVIKGAYLYKDEMAKSVWDRGISFEFLAATNIGAAETTRKARFFTMNHQVSST